MDRLDLMRTLIAVAETGSFTAAGKRLGKSKALVSKHVGDLEHMLGARLLNRTTRQVGVTEVGRAYLQRASELLGELDALEESVRANATDPRGTLKITAPQAYQELELMELLCAFQARYEHIEPVLFLADRAVDLVGEGFDVALRISSLADSTLIARKLFDVPLRVCAAPAYLKTHGKPRTPADLERHRCVVDLNAQAHNAWRIAATKTSPATAVRVPARISVNSASAVRHAVLEGVGIGLCPDFVVARDLASGRLVELFAGASEPQLAMHLLYPHRLHLSARVRAFIDFTVDWYARTPPWHRAAADARPA